MRFSIVLPFALAIVLVTSHGLAQNIDKNFSDSLIKKFEYYHVKKQQGVLFAHFDKTIYTSNENVWFTAYLLNYNRKTNDPTVLSVILINDVNRSVVLEQKFVMANGLAFGNVFIPDSIPSGDFSFIIYTNELSNGKPRNVFTQAITIKNTAALVFLASLFLIDTGKFNVNGLRSVIFKATSKEGKPIPGAEVVYHLGNYQHPVLSGRIKTDKDGQFLLSIPAIQIKAGDNILETEVRYNKETRNLKLTLPVYKNKFDVKFYPEGGNLVHATQSQVGWEAKNADGTPLKIGAVLYKDQHAIDTIHTNVYGMGNFKLAPLLGSIYEVRLIGIAKDSAYTLPKILSNGPVIGLKEAIANDSLQLKLVSKFPAKFFVIIHNYRQIFFSFPVEVNGAGKTVLINLKDVPKGLGTITVLDDGQRPCAERMFFAHYNQRTPIRITTDKSAYAPRQQVNVKLKLESAGNDMLHGIVSVACVQSTRIDARKTNDIESYVYLRSELEALPFKEKYMGQTRDDKTYLENVLLIKGWRRYYWQDLIRTDAQDTINQHNTIKFNGWVDYNGKALKKPISLMIRTDSSANIIATDASGGFRLDENKILIAENKKLRLLLSNKKEGYKISLANTFNDISESLIKEFTNKNYSNSTEGENNSSSQTLADLEHTIDLKTVTIKGRRNNNTNSLSTLYGINQCGDYVCKYNILNCPNHYHDRENVPPEIGKTYFVAATTPNLNKNTINKSSFVNGAGERFNSIVYMGCSIPESDPTMLTLNGINYAKEFYGSDYSKLNPSEPEYLSTIYWKHLCFVNSKDETTLSFYTSDITGDFKIVMQGLSGNDVISGEKIISVTKP
ncbi:MAG: hypothetical protein JWP94_2818 [Mucilaginibacter sp.]|nr:hypothetical protein [Mucilaginibacter sp.]